MAYGLEITPGATTESERPVAELENRLQAFSAPVQKERPVAWLRSHGTGRFIFSRTNTNGKAALISLGGEKRGLQRSS